MFKPQEIIRKIRDKSEISTDEFGSFFEGYLQEKVTDYQMSSMLMAIYLNGVSRELTVQLTKLARDSGKVFEWGSDQGCIADKHSTGGVGDKTSLIILPLAILNGLKVPMMSGRGLGHTGGTLDKLESIPGMNVFIEEKKVYSQVRELGGAFLGQTSEIAALDKKLYALRDVTATVESIPLMTASILCKKLAEGLDHLILDIKFGSGAFISQIENTRKLADSLVTVGKECGLSVRALLTSMNSALGDTAGNSLEVMESVQTLKGEGPKDTTDLSVELAAELVHQAFPDRELRTIKETMSSQLSSGAAFELFCRIIADQGGDISYLENLNKFEKAPVIKPLLASSTCHLEKIDVRSLGIAVLSLGGGRIKMTDKINQRVGLSALKRVGTEFQSGDEVLRIHAETESDANEALKICEEAMTFSQDPVKTENLIADRIV